MTEKELKKAQGEYKRFLLTALNVLRLNSKMTDKEYTKIRDRILGDKEVANWQQIKCLKN